MKKLSKEKRIEIRFRIQANMQQENRHPEEIIKNDYNGDETKYLLDMAKWLNVEI